MNFRFFITLFVAFFALSACEKTVINHGYVVEGADFSAIKVGTDTANSVHGAFGSPTISSSVAGSDGSYNWYYVAKRTEKVGVFSPKVVAKKTMVISFNRNDVVTSVKESTNEKDVRMVSEKTATGGKTAGVVGEAFGGLGKYMKPFKEADTKR